MVSADQIQPSVIYRTNFLLTNLEIQYFEILCDSVWITLILDVKVSVCTLVNPQKIIQLP